MLDLPVAAPLARNAHAATTIMCTKARRGLGIGSARKCGKDSRSPYRFSLKAKTIFEETKAPLRPWFKVLHLMLTSKKGMSALQIHRMLGIGSYGSAWYMCMRLRAVMLDPDFHKRMGIVEVDETYIGGKDRNRHWNKKSRQQRQTKEPQALGEAIGLRRAARAAERRKAGKPKRQRKNKRQTN